MVDRPGRVAPCPAERRAHASPPIFLEPERRRPVDDSRTRAESDRHDHRRDRPAVRRPFGDPAAVAGHRAPADRGAALLDRHRPHGRAPARRAAGGRLARRRLRLLHRRRGAEAAHLDANPSVAVTTGSTGAGGWSTGTDVVVEGTAVRVTDAPALRELAAAWSAKYGDDWRFEVRGQEFVELSRSGGATEGGARVYRVAPAKVLAFGGGHGQTLYRF